MENTNAKALEKMPSTFNRNAIRNSVCIPDGRLICEIDIKERYTSRPADLRYKKPNIKLILGRRYL